jgi:hypothetical protein
MNGGTAIIIIAVIILIVGAFVSLHFWFHVFFVLPEAEVTSTSTPTPFNSVLYAAFVGSPMINQ